VGRQRYTPLIVAILLGKKKAIKFILQVPGLNIHAKDYKHATAMETAVYMKDEKTIEHLKEAGAAY